ncbi:MAG: putative ABC transporter periplasmic-binding protein [Candidatus Methanofastidiosum methylothiophilum]|jgi:peptide/nickel transport system substrate-binding protein|uniref:Putative ABC transporter periplasmic-binding protein n=1 Tax=Candidatus Methanofastidiosum methylothiophilum TaxID=1705564 RepID=A0A150JKA9_9EURY|nr:MAG: putative ABC transporter periplasmic-binding protein [Candidatus Methanofastidiosum methylthiophilus]MBP6932380.1 ABC transporter substrate-binding protein [Methanofastidiosum sp.]OQC52254.1 MAG: putative ABC transporter periplasmic-binding protein [Euryarchaeota archaeon ADurb.Bin023]KYC57627.1 MAG: putative ABC transporter periplasmic-binding protein [Candidatus Methanofastidiosum methylthiophilus]KYC58484.1 MAG: putative ABC transporter periplasmic-binding protein [Candidatus Methano
MNKGLSIVLMSILCISLIVGCVNQGTPEKTTTTTIKIGSPNTIKAANFFDTNLGVFSKISNLTLTKMDENGKIIGNMATKYEASNNDKVWKFYINPELYWSDGKKVTPEDVKFSVEYYANKIPYAGWIKQRLKAVTVIPEENAVEILFTEPYTRTNLEFTTYNILPKHVWESIQDPMNYIQIDNYVGCGPFFISNVNLDSQIVTLKKNPYWKGKQSVVDTIEIHMYKTNDALALDLENGTLDVYYKYAGSYPYSNIQKLIDTGKYATIKKMNVGLIFLGMNLQRQPMSDVNFRNAISYAINYDEIAKIDALGYGTAPNRGFVPPTMEFYKETPKLEYNLEKAKQLLNEAGYKDGNGNGILETTDGKDIKLIMLLRPEYVRSGELVQDYLKKVGIETTLKSVDSSTWISLKDKYYYDLTITRTTPWGMLMHAQWGSGYFDSRRTGEGVLHNLSDPEFLKICDNILSTTDSGKLKIYAYDLQDYYSDNLPGITLYWNENITPYSKKFSGWYVDPLFGIYNTETFLNLQKAS